MKHYIKHVGSLYKRPLVNGIDGAMELRAASPFELFLDLIFVIALAKLTTLLELQTIFSFFEATLLFFIIYSIWFTLTTYTVMFMKKEINYWTRAMIFLVMIPLIFFLGVNNLQDDHQIMVFCMSLAISKLLLALIFRDSIVNAPLNNIVISKVYLAMAKAQIISAVLLMIAAFSHNQAIFLILLTAIAIREVIISPIKRKQYVRKSFAPFLINKQLFMERQLLFIIVIFGESLLTLITNITSSHTDYASINIIVAFSIMFMFYMRISEESEYNKPVIEMSNNLPYWLVTDYMIFLLFFVISTIPHNFAEHGHIQDPILILLIMILIYIATLHLYLDIKSLKTLDNKIDKVFHKVDFYSLIIMYIIILSITIFHSSVFIIYLQVLLYFLLHIIALPFRSHLISKKCDFAKHVDNQK